ncbi:hypothetical protein [Campylobacter rectus]|uniref:hypothetical protein n=1 Tax=Campylobacter rectus TaxID=203 RepID=UPI000FB49EE7|nr:hypothetical protein [Campylobacter rectus]RRD55366.1 hypothetical protein EII16_01300 [Campylobacter rectus]
MHNLLLLKFDCFLRINLDRSWRHFAACGLLPGGLYGYLYGVNLLNSASARAKFSAEFKASACAFLRAVKFTRPHEFLSCSNLAYFYAQLKFARR